MMILFELSEKGQTFKEWKKKANEFEKRLPGTKFTLSKLLEEIASEEDRKKGKDLADFLILHDWKTFRK